MAISDASTSVPVPVTLPALTASTDAPARLPTRAVTSGPGQRLSSRDLLGDRVEVEIDHDGAIYRLRLTSLGKLILTK